MTKLKLEEEYSHFKLFMRVRFILRLLLILLVSILFSVAVIFLWLQIVEVYNEEKQFAASDSIQQERLPVSLEVGRIYFQALDLSTQRL